LFSGRRHRTSVNDSAHNINHYASHWCVGSANTTTDGKIRGIDFGYDLVFHLRSAGRFLSTDQISDFKGQGRTVHRKASLGGDADGISLSVRRCLYRNADKTVMD